MILVRKHKDFYSMRKNSSISLDDIQSIMHIITPDKDILVRFKSVEPLAYKETDYVEIFVNAS